MDDNNWGPVADLSKRYQAPRSSGGPAPSSRPPTPQFDIVGALASFFAILRNPIVQNWLLLISVVILTGVAFVYIRTHFSTYLQGPKNQPVMRPATYQIKPLQP